MIKVIHPHQRQEEVVSGDMARFAGVSQQTAGASNIYMALARIPPGCKSSPHWHTNCESALYVLKGRGKFLVGEGLKEVLEIGPGDFIYVPPGIPHQPINESLSEPIELIVARNSPVELVEEYTP